MHGASRPDNVLARDWIALLRHRRRPASALFVRLGHLANFGLHHQCYVEREFRQASANQCEQCGRLGKAIALSVPRHVRNAEREFARECFDDSGSISAERRQRSRRAAELDHQDSRRRLIQSLEMSD